MKSDNVDFGKAEKRNIQRYSGVFGSAEKHNMIWVFSDFWHRRQADISIKKQWERKVEGSFYTSVAVAT